MTENIRIIEFHEKATWESELEIDRIGNLVKITGIVLFNKIRPKITHLIEFFEYFTYPNDFLVIQMVGNGRQMVGTAKIVRVVF